MASGYLNNYTQNTTSNKKNSAYQTLTSAQTSASNDNSLAAQMAKDNAAAAALKASAANTTAATGSSGGSSYSKKTTSSGQSVADIYAALLSQKQQAAQQAHTQGTQRLENTYNALNGSLTENLNSTLSDLNRQYTGSQNQVNQNAADAQQQAYINYMLSKRDLPQSLMAQGLTGGASESTLADLYNSYGNSRNQIDRQRMDSLVQLNDTLLSNQSAAQRLYNEQVATAAQQKAIYQQQLDQALASLQNDILDSAFSQLQSGGTSYQKALQELLQAQSTALQNAASVTYTPTNTVNSVSVRQGGAEANTLSTAAMASRAAEMLRAGSSEEEVITYLGAQGATAAQIEKSLNSLGVR